MLAPWSELEELGNVDELLTEEEKLQMTEAGAVFIQDLEEFRNSQVKVDTEELKILLEDAGQLEESSFTAETWKVFKEAVQKRKDSGVRKLQPEYSGISGTGNYGGHGTAEKSLYGDDCPGRRRHRDR